MSKQFSDCLKRERDIRIKPNMQVTRWKTAFRYNPALIKRKTDLFVVYLVN